MVIRFTGRALSVGPKMTGPGGASMALKLQRLILRFDKVGHHFFQEHLL